MFLFNDLVCERGLVSLYLVFWKSNATMKILNAKFIFPFSLFGHTLTTLILVSSV